MQAGVGLRVGWRGFAGDIGETQCGDEEVI